MTTEDPYAVSNLLPAKGESDADYLARMGALYRAAPLVPRVGRSRIPRDPLLALLATDSWTPADVLASQVGQDVRAVQKALARARRRGDPITSSQHGWRLREAT